MAKVIEGNILHVHVVRLSVTGIGSLDLSLHSADNIKSQVNPNPLVMQMLTDKSLSKLFNFKSQDTSFRLGTTEIGEYFRVNRIIIFVKPVEADFPR